MTDTQQDTLVTAIRKALKEYGNEFDEDNLTPEQRETFDNNLATFIAARLPNDHIGESNAGTVADLIGTLQQLEPDALVVLSKDGEGNAFSPLASYGVGSYIPDSTWSGEFHSTPKPGDDPEDYPDYSDDPDAVKAVVLWPTN